MRFEWAPEKDRANIKKHGLSFGEATTLFTGGEEYLEIYDAKHSEDEDRFFAIGPIASQDTGGLQTEYGCNRSD